MDRMLAKNFTPVIYFDKSEPFYPVLVGVTVFDSPGKSPTTARCFDFTDQRIGKVLEYAIYWDYDIQHLYELEHVWVYVDAGGGLLDAEASFHGRYFKALLPDRSNVEDGTHVVVYSQPGKHAFLPSPGMFHLIPNLYQAAGQLAGVDGLLQTGAFRGCYEVNQERHHLARYRLQKHAFVPTMEFVPYHIPPEILMDWPEAYRQIPLRIEQELRDIRRELEEELTPCNTPRPDREEERRLVLFLDCGDTLMDESTQVRNQLGEVISAQPIEGAVETVRALYERGHRLCLVADGLHQDFKNLLIQHGIHGCFEAFITSEAVRRQKPDRRMFLAAMGAMGLTEADIPRIVMVGNNFRKDIRGAKALGIRTVHIGWSSRYFAQPAGPEEVPDHTIAVPLELLGLAEELEAQLNGKHGAKTTV